MMHCPVPAGSHQMRRGLFHSRHQNVTAPVLLFAVLSLLSFGEQAHAEGKDPTVPPAAWQAVQPSALDKQKALPGSDISNLRLVLFGKTRRLALIDGQVIKAGDMHNGVKVVAIRRGEVLAEQKEKSLRLTPGVEKKKASRIAPRQPARIIVGGKSVANENQTGNRSSQ